MNMFLLRVSLVAAVTLGAVALGSTAQAQDPSSQAPASTAPPQQDPAGMPQDQQQTPTASQSQPQNESQMPAAGNDAQTQDAKAFTGQVVKVDGKVVLKDPVTKNTYQIDDATKVKRYMGKQVKVTGKLDMSSNTIHVDSIEPLTLD
jgi:hemolysin activation/secretion protein